MTTTTSTTPLTRCRVKYDDNHEFASLSDSWNKVKEFSLFPGTSCNRCKVRSKRSVHRAVASPCRKKVQKCRISCSVTHVLHGWCWEEEEEGVDEDVILLLLLLLW